MLRPTARAKSPRMVPIGTRQTCVHIAIWACIFTRSRGKGVGRAEHDTAGLDRIETLPDHRDDGAGGHVLDEAGEERLALEVSVVCRKARNISKSAHAALQTTYASRGARGKRGRASGQ